MSAWSILVIDDDSAVRDAFEIALGESHDLVLAGNGEDGIAAARLKRPDLIFLDLRMPGIDGVETLRRLHEIDKELEVYIVTAFAREYMESLRAAKKAGLRFQVAAKPMTTAQIREIANAVLGPAAEDN